MKKISLKRLLDDSDQQNQSTELKRLRNALIEDCYFLLIDHDVSEKVIDEAYGQSKTFHDIKDSDSIIFFTPSSPK